MPAVETVEALDEAVRAFSTASPGLVVEADAATEVRQSLDRTGMVLLGETHGVRETPLLLGELLAAFGMGGLALEWTADLRPWLDSWLTGGVLEQPPAGSSAAWDLWSGDGRMTAGHLAVLGDLTGAGAAILTLMDGLLMFAPRPGEPAEVAAQRMWTDRDAAMAARVMAAPQPRGGTLVCAGGLHVELRAGEYGVPMGAQLARERPGLRSIRTVYGPGGCYNLGPQRWRDSELPSQPGDSTRLARHGNDLVLLVPNPHEATVPHRPAP